MGKPDSFNPFVVKFLQPLCCPEMKMFLLRFENDDGSKGCIGLHEESLKSLRSVFSEVLIAIETYNNTERGIANKVLEYALTVLPKTL